MRQEVKMPKLGDTATEVMVVEWCVEIGGRIVEGEPLLTVETDKVDADVPSPMTGTLVEQLVTPSDLVAVGAPIAVIEA